jgi:hypothetical protein
MLDGDGIGIRGSALGEMLMHYQWAWIKCSHFLGREQMLLRAVSIVMHPEENATHLEVSRTSHIYNIQQISEKRVQTQNRLGVTLCIVGESGYGE